MDSFDDHLDHGEPIVPEQIVCVDCGGRCHLATPRPEDGFRPGDVVFYRCQDCLDRWDIVLDDLDL